MQLNSLRLFPLACAALLALPTLAASPSEISGIPGLALWLDATDVYADGTTPGNGDPLGRWTDKAQGITFWVHGDTWRRPTHARNSIAGRDAVHFQRPEWNRSQYAEANDARIGSLLNGTNTFFVVARSTGGSGDGNTQVSSYVFARPGWHSGLSFDGYPDSTAIGYGRWTQGKASFVTVSMPYVQGNLVLATRTVNGNTYEGPMSESLRLDAGEPVADSNGAPLWNHAENGNDNILRLGCAYIEGDYTGGLWGDICEILAFNRVLTEQEQGAVRLYLAARWFGEEFTVTSPAGGTEYTASTTLTIASLPYTNYYDSCQITANPDPAALDATAWAAPASLVGSTFTCPGTPANGDALTVYAFLRNSTEGVLNVVSNTLVYSAAAPVPVARDISLSIDSSGRRAIDAAEIDLGSYDPFTGIASRSVSPAYVYEGANTVTLTVVNGAGVSASTNVTVTCAKRARVPQANPELPVTDGLDAWYKGEYLDIIGYEDGAAIPAMHDFSNHDHHMWRWTDDTRYVPTVAKNAINGHTAYRFDGNDVMQNGGIPPGAAVTVFFVAKGSSYMSMVRWQDGNGFLIYPWAGDEILINDKNGSTDAGDNAGAETGLLKGRWNIATAVIQPGVERGVKTYRNGLLVDWSTWNNAITGPNRLMIGAYQLDGEFADCDLAEVLIYNRALSDAERVEMQDYLREKYALLGCFEVADPTTGSRFYTSSNEVAVADVPDTLPAGCYIQFSDSATAAGLDPAAWSYYDAENPPFGATVAFTPPASGEAATVYLWTRTFDNGSPVYASYPASFTYYAGAPTAVATNISIAIDTTAGTEITPDMIDGGSSDSTVGIASMSVSPAVVHGTTQVTLTVVNNAGVSSTATATVTASAALDAHVAPNGDDANGAGTAASPWRTVTHAVANTAGGGTIYLAPGTYSSGETFPIDGSNRSFRREPAATGDAVIDCAYAANHVFTVAGGASISLLDLTLADSVGAAILAAYGDGVPAARVTAERCVFLQPHENWNWEWDGAISAFNGSTLEFTDCAFRLIKRHSVIRAAGATTLLLDGCLFEGNTNIYATIAMNSAPNARVTMTDTVFRRNWAQDGFPHDGAYSAVIYLAGGYNQWMGMTVDRCEFYENEGGDLFALGYADTDSVRIRNSLFVDNIAHEGEFHGYCERLVNLENCTFIRDSGGFSTRYVNMRMVNCLVSDVGALTFTAPGDAGRTGFAQGLALVDTILWNTPEGEGYNTAASSGVVTGENPWLESVETNGVAIAREDPAFDARPRPYSPAIDGCATIRAPGYTDLDGNPRIADNNGDYVETGDIGCYESTFHAAATPTFTVPVPGSLSGFRGVSYSIPVTIYPAASGPVTAVATASEGIRIDNENGILSFASGSDTATLSFTVLSGSSAAFGRIAIAESGTSLGVEPGVFDVFMDTLSVTMGGKTKFFLAEGRNLDIPVSLALEGGTAPGNIAIQAPVVRGAGTSSAAWTGGTAAILAGEHSSAGFYRITGGLGVNTVTISSAAVFTETDDNEVEITVIGYPGWVAVDPVEGDDDTGTGTAALPLRTVGYAVSQLSSGDEVRLLPGTYSSATETFPLTPGSVNLTGWDPEGETDVSRHVLTGSNTDASLVHYRTGDAAAITGLTLRDSTDALLFAEGSAVAVTNVLFTQSAENYGASGAIHYRDNSAVSAVDCVFTNIHRLGVTVASVFSYNDNNRFSAERCVFRDNVSNYGTVLYLTDPGLVAHVTLVDTLFENCDVLGNYVSDSYAGTIVYFRQGGNVTADRCRFIGCDNGTLFSINYGSAEIRNSLFAGCVNNAGVFDGSGNANAVIRNCTVTGCTGGFNCFDVTCSVVNSILSGVGEISFVRRDLGGRTDLAWHTYKPIYFHDTILWDVGEGLGYTTNGSSNVYVVDPGLRGALAYDEEGMDYSGVDPRLRTTSPAIDAGNNTHVLGDLDIFGEARIKVGFHSNAEAIVDIGCFESDTVSLGTIFLMR